MKKLVCALVLLLSIAVQAQEQKRGNVFMRMPDGRDSLLMQMSIIDSGMMERQEKLIFFDKEGKVQTYSPADHISGFTMGSQRYNNIKVKMDDGEVKQMFALRKYYRENDLSVYAVYTDKKSFRLYMGKEGDVMIPATNDSDPSYGNKLTDYELEKNRLAGGNDELAEYIQKKGTSMKNIRLQDNLIKNQNPNFIPRFRWGVGIGLNLNSRTFANKYLEGINMGNQCQLTGTLFADVKTFTGLSFHPEVSFLKASAKEIAHEYHTFNSNPSYDLVSVLCNRTSITMPLLLRYYFCQVKGKVIPYVEGGSTLGFNLKNEYKDFREHTEAGNTTYDMQHYDGIGVEAYATVGAGVEYRLNRKHSLFLDCRYNIPLYKASYNKFEMRINSLMFNLAINL